MGDRGYKDAEKMFQDEGIKFIRPPSVSAGNALPKDIAIQAKSIASLRINVERVIGKVRSFEIVSKYTRIKSHYRKYVDYYILIACGLANMLKPIYDSK